MYSYAYINFRSPDCKCEIDDDVVCLVSFLNFYDNKDIQLFKIYTINLQKVLGAKQSIIKTNFQRK